MAGETDGERATGDLVIASLAERYVSVRAGLEARERDPLSWWTHVVKQSREATLLLNEASEVMVRAANKGGKTEWEYAVGLAMLQKRPTLDGIPLPQWRGPVEAVSLEIDHPTQRLSSQKTLMRLLGKWPHEPHYKGDRILSTLLVQPINGNDDRSTWSRLTFMSQENMTTGQGVRGDLILGNEPPKPDIWGELRKAAEAGRPMKRIIGMTPIIRRQWYWLADEQEFGRGCPRGGIRRNGKFAEVRWSLEDNKALSAAEIAELIAEYQRQPALFDARVHGDYVATEGACPFDIKTLNLMLEECREPEIVEWKVSREAASGKAHQFCVVPVEVYDRARPGRSYYAPSDPASGTDDNRHDPLATLVSEIGSGDLQAEYSGYISPYSMGALQAGLGRQYNMATADIEMNDRWGVSVHQALMDADYPNIAHEQRELQPGVWSKEPGFQNNAKTRPAMIGAVQAWIESWRAGVKYARCPSRKVIECLMDCILDEKGKIVAAPGMHDERLILWGQSLRRAVTRSGMIPPDLYEQPMDPEDFNRKLEKKYAAELAEDDDRAPYQVPNYYRSRPRW